MPHGSGIGGVRGPTLSGRERPGQRGSLVLSMVGMVFLSPLGGSRYNVWLGDTPGRFMILEEPEGNDLQNTGKLTTHPLELDRIHGIWRQISS